MCGIGFFSRYKTKKFDLDMIKKTFISLESRGTDASGLYYERIENIDGKDVIAKRAVKSPFKTSELYPVFQDSKHALNGTEYFIMMHSRAKTVGTAYKNVNNHPVFSENYVLIHNGTITTKPLDFYDYQGEVDTEIGVSFIETFGIEKGISLLEGGISFVFKEKKAKEFFLYRHHNPMNIAYNIKDGVLCGTSEIKQLPYSEETSFPENILNPGTTISETDKYQLYKVSLRTQKPEIEKLIKVETSSTYVHGSYISKESQVEQAIDEYKTEKLKTAKKPAGKKKND